MFEQRRAFSLTLKTAVLSTMYLTAVGAVMVAYGIILREYRGNLYQLEPITDTIILLFSGGLITTTFWVCKCVLLYAPLFHDCANYMSSLSSVITSGKILCIIYSMCMQEYLYIHQILLCYTFLGL